MTGRLVGALIACAAIGFTFADARATQLSVYRGPGCVGKSRMAAFDNFLGRKAQRTVDALAQTTWPDLDSSIDYVVGCWKNSGLQLTLSVPMMPRQGSGSFADGIAGKHDASFRHVATSLVANGFSTAVVRIGWEFNGDWMPWAAGPDPKGYIADFRHIVQVMRSAPGQKFKFEWTPNVGLHNVDPWPAYPGDDVVDFVGMDVYDEIWSPDQADPRVRWQTYMNEPFGLRWHKSFATSHRKPTAYSEWGTGTRPDGHGAGDDPVFIAGMADWFAQSKPLYQSYWDNPSPEFNCEISNWQFPNAARVFLARFGKNRAGDGHEPQ